MKSLSLLKLTAHENYRGQVLWVSILVAAVTLLLTFFVSEAALGHQSRLVDVASYFLVDMVAFLTALFMGVGIFSKDFSNRGIAEIAIPAGTSRERLFLLRIGSHALCLGSFLVALFGGRILVLMLVDALSPDVWSDTARMFAFSFLKSALALALGGFLGCFARPVVALLGSVGLFALGHFSTGISGLQGIISESRMVTPGEELLFRIFRVWNPNYLLLESLKGAWERPAAGEFLGRIGWGVAAFFVFALLGALAVRRKDIGALRI